MCGRQTFVDLDISHRTLCDIDLLFEGQKLKILISMKRWDLVQKCTDDFERFEYLLTNDTIAKDTSNDLELLFQGKKFEIFISRK